MSTITVKDGTTIYYKDWGKGPVVTFSHGWPLSSDAWDGQMLFLAQHGFRVVAHDRRGHGRSSQASSGNDMNGYADDLAAVIEALDLKDVTLVGHSTGGGEVTRYIGRHGTKRVAAAILIAAVPPILVKSATNPEGLPIEVFAAGYSKNQELEADREGVRLAVGAGYSASGAIRMFETFERFYQESRARVKNPGQELTQTAIDTLDGYFRSHPLTSERVDQIQKMIAERRWQPVAERDLQVAYISWARKAESAFAEHQYERAQQLATHSLKIKSGNRKALQILARAEFSQASFSEAATTYRELLDTANPDIDAARSFALSLAAADRHAAKPSRADAGSPAGRRPMRSTSRDANQPNRNTR